MTSATTRGLMLPLALFAAGCVENAPSAPPTTSPGELGSQFNAATTGTVRGRVIWSGAAPQVLPYRAPISPLSEQSDRQRRFWPNANAPDVDPLTRGVRQAVVFLRGVEPARSRPWDLPAVQVELRDYQIHVRQGDTDSHVGFVRRGANVEIASRQPVLHTLQARGAAFFALAFPQESLPCARPLRQTGVVELSSGAGHFWMRGYLFVDEHPYYVRTDHAGQFLLSRVPAGSYDAVCWLPDWREAEHERDADTALICRLTYRPPLQIVRRISVQPGQTCTLSFTPGVRDFSP